MGLESAQPKPIAIVIADDDADDRMLARDALAEARLANDLFFVQDGEELLDFLRHRGRYADPAAAAPRPGLVLLDLNMPRMDGREALAEIKADPELRVIPVVILTTSQAEEDIVRSYALHANAYVTKPVDFERFIEVIRQIDNFFITVVKLPHGS
jgi:CheY-like chemotaxis protein